MSLKEKWNQRKWKNGPCAAIIVAAGQASRMGGVDKILADLDGEPVICRSIRPFQACDLIREIIVVTRKDQVGAINRLCIQKGFDKVCMVTEGGDSRTASVMAGLEHVGKDVVLAAVHDGARPLITVELVERTIRDARTFGAAAPAVPVKDTIKTAENRIVTGTPDRSSLYAVQTPQVFDFDLLRGALEKAEATNMPLTDDCSAVEALGMSVYLSRGDEENIKLTTPMDLILARAILERRRQA